MTEFIYSETHRINLSLDLCFFYLEFFGFFRGLFNVYVEMPCKSLWKIGKSQKARTSISSEISYRT